MLISDRDKFVKRPALAIRPCVDGPASPLEAGLCISKLNRPIVVDALILPRDGRTSRTTITGVITRIHERGFGINVRMATCFVTPLTRCHL